MDKQEIKQLLTQIKVFYPRFDAVEKDGGSYMIMAQTVDSWHRVIGWMDYDRAVGILDRYMESDQGAKTPTVSLWKHGGKTDQKQAWHSAWFDQRNGAVVWQPEDGPKYELKASCNRHGDIIDEEFGYIWGTPGGE